MTKIHSHAVSETDINYSINIIETYQYNTIDGNKNKSKIRTLTETRQRKEDTN